MMNNARRTLCQSLISAISLSGITACSQPATRAPQRTYTEEQQRHINKFRGVRGYDLSVDIFKGYPRGTECLVFDDNDNFMAGGIGIHTARVGIPISIYASLFGANTEQRPLKSGKYGLLMPGGDLLGQWTVPVSARIPDDLLDDLRRDPKGTLRIKIRLHREGVLLGWDIERRPGYDPKKLNAYGNPVFVSAVHSFAGGDFREAEIINGQAVRKGWYIHPKTGQRIETDF